MLKPNINELLDMTGSRYSLVIAASKRARQIIDGAEPMTTANSIKPVSIATQEIYESKIECVEAVDAAELEAVIDVELPKSE